MLSLRCLPGDNFKHHFRSLQDFIPDKAEHNLSGKGQECLRYLCLRLSPVKLRQLIPLQLHGTSMSIMVQLCVSRLTKLHKSPW